MEGGESPLEVLSRAATMVQENQKALANIDDTTKKQSMKWKRDRRSRLPEYSRKSDPKIGETFSSDQSQSNGDNSDGSSGSPNGFSCGGSSPEQQQNGVNKCPTATPLDAPIDMSVRQRGQPPSYSQTINNPGYRSTYKPAMVNNGARNEMPSEGISMCDPIIDEHFRRSLGSDYHILFSNNNVPKETTTTATITATTKTTTVSSKLKTNSTNKESSSNNATEFMDTAGLSVDDHFAKALGDTWIKLNKKEPDIKNTASESLVSI